MTAIRRSISFSLCIFFLIGTLKAQVRQVSLPTKSSATANAPTAPPYQLAVKVRRVVLDVVVTDRSGNPVEGLKADDFKVMEDGKIQPVHFFDVHGVPATDAAQRVLDLHLAPDTFSNLALAPADKPVTVLVYDLLNTPQDALARAHKALVKFIEDQKSSTRIAIFVLTDRLHMVQGFTDDETQLLNAVDSKKTKTRVSQLLTADSGAADKPSVVASDPAGGASAQQPNGVGADPAAGNATEERTGGATTPVGEAAVLQMLNNVVANESDYFGGKRIEITVHAFTEIARFVSSLPGRKNVIWMCGSFPAEFWPGRKPASNNAMNFNIEFRFDNEIRAAHQAMKESRVAIYPVDIRGLQVDPSFSAAASSPAIAMPAMGAPGQVAMTFGVQQGAQHAYMNALADTTGGRAFYNTNGLQEAMDLAARQGSEYYTLTYAPTNSKDDGGERKVKVVLTNPNYQLSYRRRYLAQDDRHPSPTQSIALDESMRHGAPNSTELFFKAKVTPIDGAMTASAEEVEIMKTFLQTTAKSRRTKLANGAGKVQHYDINVAIAGRQLQFPRTQNGRYATGLRFGLAAFTEDGELLNGIEFRIRNTIPSAQYQTIKNRDYHASMLFVVPEEAVSLRVAVQDEIGNRIGTLEIPLPIVVPRNNNTDATQTK